MSTTMPTAREMYRACCHRDSQYDGVFFLAVKTTGIFCRPTCAAKTPLEKNVRYFASASDALAAGFRPCKRCRPMEVSGCPPQWLHELIDHFESDPHRKWTDADIRQFDVEPKRVRRWFQHNHGITFHGYLRSRRLATALGQLSLGDDPVRVALDAGYESLSGFYEAFQKWCGLTPGMVSANGSSVLMVNRILSPLGPIIVVTDREQLHLLEFADRRMLESQFKRLIKLTGSTICPGETKLMERVSMQLDQYFSGRRTEFEINFQLQGSNFQQQVWEQLLQIPYGHTLSYDEVAKRIGNPKAQRAVGRANGDNRLAMIIPCHRVIRSDGSLSGYGGGVRRKEWMLQLERSIAGTGDIMDSTDSGC